MRTLFAICMTALLLIGASCGRSRTPDNVITGQEIVSTGAYQTVNDSTDPIPVSDTLYQIEPTWKQANQFAAGRKDFVLWQVIGWLLLIVVIASSIDYWRVGGRFFSKMDVTKFITIMVVILAIGFLSCHWQSSSIKWNNGKKISKSYYDRLMKDPGSMKPVWDSLEQNCLISNGPYGCYK